MTKKVRNDSKELKTSLAIFKCTKTVEIRFWIQNISFSFFRRRGKIVYARLNTRIYEVKTQSYFNNFAAQKLKWAKKVQKIKIIYSTFRTEIHFEFFFFPLRF